MKKFEYFVDSVDLNEKAMMLQDYLDSDGDDGTGWELVNAIRLSEGKYELIYKREK